MYLHQEICFFYLVSYQNKLSVEHINIKLWTEKGTLLSKFRKLIQSNVEIPETEAELRPYSQKASELSVVDGTLLWGS